jgi:hypothetical protein
MKIYRLKVELGYIGYDMTCLIGSEPENIPERATEAALDHYYSYDIEDDNIRSITEIMEDDGVDQDEAERIRTEEVLENIDIDYEEYDPTKHGQYSDYTLFNIDRYDIDKYLVVKMRDVKIDQILK